MWPMNTDPDRTTSWNRRRRGWRYPITDTVVAVLRPRADSTWRWTVSLVVEGRVTYVGFARTRRMALHRARAAVVVAELSARLAAIEEHIGYPVRDAIQREFDAWNDYSETPAEVIARRDEAETTLQQVRELLDSGTFEAIDGAQRTLVVSVSDLRRVVGR